MRPALEPLASFVIASLLAAAAPLPAAGAPVAGNHAWAPWGPGQGTIQGLALDPVAAPAGVCAAPQLGGVFCSGNGGGSWEAQSAGLDGANVVALAVSPWTAGLFAATAGGAIYRRDGAGWELVDDGHAWEPLSSSLGDRPFGVLLVPSPARGRWPARLYLAAATRVFFSDDGGSHWHQTLTTTAPVSDLAVDLVTPRIVYVASHSDPNLGHPAPGGLLKSADGGVSWTPIAPVTGWPSGVLAVAVGAASPAAPAALYAAPGYPGLLRSRDGGASWQALSTATMANTSDLVTALAVDPDSPETLVASRADGVFLSRDGGDSWSLFGGQGQPFLPYDVTRLVIGPGAQRLYAPTHLLGLFATASRGRRWTAAFPTNQAGEQITGRLRFDPADPATIVALLNGFAYRSRDGGASWAVVGAPFVQQPALDAVIDLVFGPPATGTAKNTLYAATGGGLLASGDGGASWRSLGVSGIVSAVAVLTPRTLLAGGCGAVLSRDGGLTWIETLSCDDPGNGTQTDDFQRQVNALLVDPADPRKVYARVTEISGLDGGPFLSMRPRVFRSADGGVTWLPVLNGSSVVAIDPSRPGAVYLLAGTELRRSADHGRTFTSIRTSGLARFEALDLAVDPASPTILYAAGQGGVRRSADGGRTWSPAEEGLAPQLPLDPLGGPSASGVFFDPATPGRVFVAANGVFYQAAVP